MRLKIVCEQCKKSLFYEQNTTIAIAQCQFCGNPNNILKTMLAIFEKTPEQNPKT